MPKLNQGPIAKITNYFTGLSELSSLLTSGPSLAIEQPQSDNIDLGSVAKWNEFGNGITGTVLQGWTQPSGNMYQSINVNVPELGTLCRRKEIPNWHTSISNIAGFAASKSELKTFRTTDEMAQANCSDLISEVSEAALDRILQSRQMRGILEENGIAKTQYESRLVRNNNDHSHRAPASITELTAKTVDRILQQRKLSTAPEDHRARLTHSQWDGRIFFNNSDGSHHFAAAKYISEKLGKDVPLVATLEHLELDHGSISRLKQNYAVFAISNSPEAANAFHKAMEAYGATYMSTPLPEPYVNAQAVFLPLLPQPQNKSKAVADMLRSAGLVDLTEHLMTLANRPSRFDIPAPTKPVLPPIDNAKRQRPRM